MFMTGPNIAAGNPTVATFPIAIAKPEAKPAFCNPTSMAIVLQSFSGSLVSLPPQYPKMKPMMLCKKQAKTSSGCHQVSDIFTFFLHPCVIFLILVS